LRVLPWHLPYNSGKSTEKPQSKNNLSQSKKNLRVRKTSEQKNLSQSKKNLSQSKEKPQSLVFVILHSQLTKGIISANTTARFQ
jgi:hypothetical protein